MDLCVVERLVTLIDRFGVDAFAGVGVVLDLDRQVAADGFDEDPIFDRDVRVLASLMLIAGRALPLKLVLRREAKLRGRCGCRRIPDLVAVDEPLERLDVADGLCRRGRPCTGAAR